MPISSSSDNLDKFYNVKIGKEHDFKLSHAGNIFSRNVKKKKNHLMIVVFILAEQKALLVIDTL